MQITRNSLETNAGPSEWFTGAVYLDPIASPAGSSRALTRSGCTSRPARARPGTRTRTARRSTSSRASARAQRRGGPVETLQPGDRVFFEPGEDHWHGAAPDRFMCHLAVLDVDDEGIPATWGQHVTDEEYGAG